MNDKYLVPMRLINKTTKEVLFTLNVTLQEKNRILYLLEYCGNPNISKECKIPRNEEFKALIEIINKRTN